MRTQIEADPARRLNNVWASLVMLAIVPGVLVLGWRAALTVLGLVACASLLRRLMSQQRLPRPRRWPPTWPLETLLLCALLPAELAAGAGEGGRAIETRWMIIPSAAILLVLAQRLRQAVPWPAFDPVILAALLLHLALGPMVDPRGALDRGALLRGDVTAAAGTGAPAEPWFQRPRAEGAPGLRVPWAGRQLDDYLSGRLAPDDLNRGSNLDALIRDKLPPIEDLLLLGHPMPIGTCSGIAIVGLMLWATYRRLIDWRIPLAATLACYVALALLPTPTSVAIEGRNWRAFPSIHVDVGVATGLTFVHYMLLASPALFVFGLVATRGDVRPLHGRAMLVWAIGLGLTTAAAMLYVSVIVGPLIAMLPAPLLARWADRWLGRRPLALPD